MGKSNLANEGWSWTCAARTRTACATRNTSRTRRARPTTDGVAYEHDLMLVKVFYGSRYPLVRLVEEELSEGETHGLTLLGWGAARHHVHHVAAGPHAGHHGVRPLAGPVPLLQRGDIF